MAIFHSESKTPTFTDMDICTTMMDASTCIVRDST